jgi:tartronate-semialdehyde synthase
MQLAEVVVKILEKEGVTDAFGIPGAGINPVYKYLKSSPIRHHIVRHEEAAVHAADGYFRSSGKISLAICTSGPGATNFITGLYTAKIDSIPLIAITGQAKTSQLGTDAFQCVDIASIAALVTKKSICVLDSSTIEEVMKDAIWTAKEGRPGPVLIDLPLDVQMADVEFLLDDYLSRSFEAKKPDLGLVEKAIDLLDSAKKPLIIMGGGVILAKAEKELVAFAEYMNIPVITTYMAKGGIPEAHPLNAGQVGIQVGASSCGNGIFLESDVVLGIGCRFTDRHTGDVSVYQGDRKFIHVDIDAKEIGKIVKPEIGILSDAREALISFLSFAKEKPARKGALRVETLVGIRKSTDRKGTFDGDVIDPRDVYIAINETFDDDTLFTTGCGLNQIWSGQYQKTNLPRHYLPSGGAGTLGFDIPAAIGASVGVGKKAVCVMGDFGFTFMVEELACAAKYNLPIVVIILNNACLSLIRQNQKYAYKYEYEVALKENKNGFIDYMKISEGFGCKAERIGAYSELYPALQRAAKSTSPYVVEILVDNEQDCNMGNDIAHIKTFE